MRFILSFKCGLFWSSNSNKKTLYHLRFDASCIKAQIERSLELLEMMMMFIWTSKHYFSLCIIYIFAFLSGAGNTCSFVLSIFMIFE